MVLYTSYPLRQRQVGFKFQAILGYIMKAYLKTTKRHNNNVNATWHTKTVCFLGFKIKILFSKSLPPVSPCFLQTPQLLQTSLSAMKQVFEHTGLRMFQFQTILVRVSVAVLEHHDQRASWGGKGYFSSHFHGTVHYCGKSGQELKQGRSLEAGIDAEAVEGCCLLACSHCLLSLLSYGTQDHHPEVGTTYHRVRIHRFENHCCRVF